MPVHIIEHCSWPESEVRLTFLQVFQHRLMRFETDNIGNVELLHQYFQQVDIVAVGLTLLIDERIRPKIHRVFLH